MERSSCSTIGYAGSWVSVVTEAPSSSRRCRRPAVNRKDNAGDLTPIWSGKEQRGARNVPGVALDAERGLVPQVERARVETRLADRGGAHRRVDDAGGDAVDAHAVFAERV